MRTALILFAVFLPGLLPETKTETPVLTISSRFGVDQDVKVYNDEEVAFRARIKGDERAGFVRGVTFILYRKGGKPNRDSDVITETEEKPRWGRPPPTLYLPLDGRPLPVGEYRLLAKKRGCKSAEISVVQARFRYVLIDTVHKKDRYSACMAFLLHDKTEKRPTVTLRVRVESATGATVDRTEHKLTPMKSGGYKSALPLKLSSNAKLPERGKSVLPGRALKIKPGCRLVASLGEMRFSWPVPLPSDEKRGNDGTLSGD